MADTTHFAFRATHDLGRAAYADWADVHLGTFVTGKAEKKGDFLEAIMALPWLAKQPGVDFRSSGDLRSLHALMTAALAEATALALAARVAGSVTQLSGPLVAKKADRAAAARTIHPNRAARMKSRLSARILAASKAVSPA